MSTRIRDGLICRSGIATVYDLLIECKPAAIGIARSIRTGWVARRAAHLIDDAAMSGRHEKHPLIAAWSEMRDRSSAIARSGLRDPDIDLGFELWIFPRGDQTLIMAKSEQRRLSEWFSHLPFVEDHSYWDDTDPPEGIPEAEWDRRGADWDEVLPGAGAPSDRCLTFQMLDPNDIWTPDAPAAFAALPTRESRISRLAERTHVNEIMSSLAEDHSDDPEWRPDFADVMAASSSAKRDAARRIEIEGRIAPLLPHITVEMLLQP